MPPSVHGSFDPRSQFVDPSLPYCPKCSCYDCHVQRSYTESVPVRVYDYLYSSSYSERIVYRESDGSIDLTKLAEECGLSILVPFVVGRDNRYPTDPETFTSTIHSDDVRFILNVSCQPFIALTEDYLSNSLIRSTSYENLNPRRVVIRFYPSPSTKPEVFKQSVHYFDLRGRFSLGNIARKYGVANVQAFDLRDEHQMRYETALRLTITEEEWEQMIDAQEGFLAVTEAAYDAPCVPLPVRQPDYPVLAETHNSRRSTGWFSQLSSAIVMH